MSGSNSDSEGSWTVVARDMDTMDKGNESSGSSSADFVKVEGSEAVSYHHKLRVEEVGAAGMEPHDMEGDEEAMGKCRCIIYSVLVYFLQIVAVYTCLIYSFSSCC